MDPDVGEPWKGGINELRKDPGKRHYPPVAKLRRTCFWLPRLTPMMPSMPLKRPLDILYK